jgi:hypothetical protein
MSKAKPDQTAELIAEIHDLTAALRDGIEAAHDLMQAISAKLDRLTPLEQRVGPDPNPPQHRGSHDRG